MSYHIKKPVSAKTLPPAGTHVARVFSIVHLGTHKKEGKDGKPWEVAESRITFELPLETKVFKEGDAPKPIVITKKYTESLGEKSNLRKLIEAVIGVSLIDAEAYAFDMHEIIGKSCMITIKHKVNESNNEKYAYVESTNALMKGVECPPQVNPSYIFTVVPFEDDKFSKLPEFIQKEIMESPEYKNRLTDEQKGQISELRKKENDAMDELSGDKDTGIDPKDIPF